MNAEQLQSLVRYATLAPSSHNTQPWRFRVAERYIDIAEDVARALPQTDPQRRELAISCGCALMNLRIAALRLLLQPHVELLPDGLDADTCARVEWFAGEAGEFDQQLFDAIPGRRTHRKAFTDRAVSDELVRGLDAAATREGGWLTVIAATNLRGTIADLVADGDRTQWANEEWRRELANWLRPRQSGDGLPMPFLKSVFTRARVRRSDLGESMAARSRKLVMDAPVLAVLGTYGDAKADWLVGGQALQRMLLWGVGNGLQAGFLNQPLQVPALRERVTNLLGVAGFPQMVVRIGYPAEELTPTPRRPLEDVMRMLI
jgi:hypothetical protein